MAISMNPDGPEMPMDCIAPCTLVCGKSEATSTVTVPASAMSATSPIHRQMILPTTSPHTPGTIENSRLSTIAPLSTPTVQILDPSMSMNPAANLAGILREQQTPVGKTTALGTKALCVVWNYKALFECLVPLHNALPRAHSYDGVGYAPVYTDRTPAHAH